MSFEQWMQEVDERCMAEFSLSIHDLPDMSFWDSFADGLSPREFMAEYLPDLDALGHLVFS